MEILARLVALLFDLFGEAMVHAACDAECEKRKGRDAATAKAEAAFGPIPDAPWLGTHTPSPNMVPAGRAVDGRAPVEDDGPLPEGYHR